MDENIKNRITIIKEWAKINLVGNIYLSPVGDIHITMAGIKETLNQPHKLKHKKDEAIYLLPTLLKHSRFAGSAPDAKMKVKEYHYLEIIIAETKSYIVIKETWENRKHFYSIVDKLKEK